MSLGQVKRAQGKAFARSPFTSLRQFRTPAQKFSSNDARDKERRQRPAGAFLHCVESLLADHSAKRRCRYIVRPFTPHGVWPAGYRTVPLADITPLTPSAKSLHSSG
jgi:hypothetical protein